MKKVALSISLLILLVSGAVAQINLSKPVGVLDGKPEVSLDGAATYSVPVEVPKGVAGMQPTLAISYNSRTTDGLAGWGWNLSGLSGITRGNQTKYHNGLTIPVRFNADDNFYLDGQLLMPTSGTNGGNGTVYETEAKTYSKIESFGSVNGDPDWWRVTSKDGSVMEYGVQTNDRLRSTANFSWFISSAKDVNNNAITYNYYQYDNDIYLDNLTYSNITIQLNYGWKQNTSVAFVGGVGFKGSHILTMITINIDGVRQLDYKLNQEVKLKRHYLKSIELVGTDNVSSVLTNFDYGNVDGEEGSSMTSGYYSTLNSYGVTLVPGDYDGDGRTDLLVADKQARLNKDYTVIDSVTSQRYDIITDILPGSGFSSQLKWSQNLPQASYVKQNDLTSPYASYPTDFNGNGREGLIRSQNINHKFQDSRGDWHEDGMSYTQNLAIDKFEPNGSGGITGDTTHLSLPYSMGYTYNFYLKDANSFVQGDFDGDGKGDEISIMGYKYQSGEHIEEKRDCFFCGWYVYRRTPIYDYTYKAFFTNTSNGYYNSEILGLGNEAKDAKAIYAIDFDGDGKQELIIFKAYSYLVYAINPISATSGYSFQATQILNASNISYNSYKQVMAGDFNGDKKTDVACISNNSSYATVFYSSGTDFKSAPLYLQYTPNFDYKFAKLPGAIPRPARFVAADLNGDGLTDIFQSDTYTESYSIYVGGGGSYSSFNDNGGYECNNGTCTYYNVKQRQAVYYSKGLDYYENYQPTQTTYVCASDWNDFSYQHPDAMIVYSDYGGCYDPYTGQPTDNYYVEYDYQPVTNYYAINTIVTSAYSINNTPYFPLSIGDFDGDGKQELLQGDRQQYYLVNGTNGIGSLGNVSLLNKVTDGFGNETTFTYGSLAEKSSSPIYTTTGALTNNYPINVMAVPVKVVKTFQSPDGIGGAVTRSYKYEDLVLDRQKGLLGFAKMTTSSTLGDKSESISLLNSYYRLLLSKTNNTYLNDTLLSTSVITNTIVPLSTSATRYYTSFNRVKVQPSVSVERNLISGAAIKRELSYDSYDNVTQQVIKTGYWNGSDVTELEAETTTTQYTQTGKALVPIFATQVTVGNTKGSSTSSKISTMAYTSDRGLLQSRTEWATTPIAATTSYTYNNYGNATQMVNAVPGKPDLTTTYTYDAAQKFVTNTVASCAGIVNTSSTTYHPLWATLLTKTEGDGTTGSLTTTYEYDATGKIKKTTTPLGHIINEGDTWDVDNNVGGTRIYYHFIDYPDGVKADQKVWYDRLGRPVKTQVLGWNNQWTTQTQNYDSKGRELSATSPYYVGEDVLTTTNVYGGPFGQLSATITPHGTSTLAYSYPGSGQIIITQTNPAGQVISNKKDAIGLTTETTDHGGTIIYDYNEKGALRGTAVNGTTMQTVTYDAYGRKIQLADANAGTSTYQYDAANMLTQQTDANGKMTSFTYDGVGRITSRTTVEGTITYQYYNTSNNKALWKAYNANHIKEIVYDNYRRVSTETETISGEGNFTTTYNYDANDNLASTTYPSGTIVQQTYNNAGMLATVTSAGQTLYNATDYNGFGKASGYYLANGLQSTITYTKGLPTKYYTSGIQDLRFDFDLATGNLNSRYDAMRGLTEVFTYDNLNRLTTAAVNGTQQFAISYDGSGTSQSVGNIVSKSDIGSYTYMTAKPNAVAYVSPMAGASPLINDAALSVSYSSFQRPLQIVKGANTLDLTYGVDDERIKTVQSVGGVLETKLFIGNYERQVLNGGSTVNHIIYVQGGNGLCAMIVNGAPHAVYTDYLGSILTVTDASGTVVAQQNFDAWGRKRDPNNWTYAGVSSVPAWLYRGYTGHEQLEAFELINMNARLYDPYTGRMLSLDNYSGYLAGTQGLNRYSYANNNPLKFIDPSGEVFGIDDALIILAMAYFGGVQANFFSASENGGNPFNPGDWNWKSPSTYIGIGSGALSGMGMAGIQLPTLFPQIDGIIPRGLFQAGENVLINGIANTVTGEPFFKNWGGVALSGFVYGGISGYNLANEHSKNLWWGSDVGYNRNKWSFFNSDIPDETIDFRIPSVGSKLENDCVPTTFAEIETRRGDARTYENFKTLTKYQDDIGVSTSGVSYRKLVNGTFTDVSQLKPNEYGKLFDANYMRNAANNGEVFSVHFGGVTTAHADNVRTLQVFYGNPTKNRLTFRQSSYNFTNSTKGLSILSIFRFF
ncbi:FG-GAP-like repeat-containing protein [Niabella pedocola]|uniref:FG-GAP-like repeat-containing protein n=1 Tax=Niabella pedocola TaxID=1752077 RepID=A0ABS8PTQ7_9BACT|nr:FG-GAP-like repeat-containing protein [Niabella pedocola]MCD2424454.1 FG-GAP-like repeat-containing protein [Niabella pedocola]